MNNTSSIAELCKLREERKKTQFLMLGYQKKFNELELQLEKKQKTNADLRKNVKIQTEKQPALSVEHRTTELNFNILSSKMKSFKEQLDASLSAAFEEQSSLSKETWNKVLEVYEFNNKFKEEREIEQTIKEKVNVEKDNCHSLKVKIAIAKGSLEASERFLKFKLRQIQRKKDIHEMFSITNAS